MWFFLDPQEQYDLKITIKTIKKAIMRFTCQMLKHLINERQWKMILLCFYIQPLVVDADSLTVLHSSWDKFIPLIL